MEENLWAKESFITNIYHELLLGDIVDSVISFQPLRPISIVLYEFFQNVRAYVAVPFLNNFDKLFTPLKKGSHSLNTPLSPLQLHMTGPKEWWVLYLSEFVE